MAPFRIKLEFEMVELEGLRMWSVTTRSGVGVHLGLRLPSCTKRWVRAFWVSPFCRTQELLLHFRLQSESPIIFSDFCHQGTAR